MNIADSPIVPILFVITFVVVAMWWFQVATDCSAKGGIVIEDAFGIPRCIPAK